MLRQLCWIGVVLAFGAHAEEQFDRSAEVDRYLTVITSGTRGAVIESGRDIYNSGVSDRRLATALAARLTADLQAVSAYDKIGQQYLQWTMKALAANGIEEYAAPLHAECKAVHAIKLSQFCMDEVKNIPRYAARNRIMASTENHHPGDDPQASRLLNLIKSDDFSFKLYAADRMNWERILDPRLLREVNSQVLRYMDSTTRGVPHDQAKAIGLYIKLLGYSGNLEYRDTLEKVLKSKASSVMKKHAREALDRLRQ